MEYPINLLIIFLIPYFLIITCAIYIIHKEGRISITRSLIIASIMWILVYLLEDFLLLYMGNLLN